MTKICDCADAAKAYFILNPDSVNREEILSLNPPLCYEERNNALSIDGVIKTFSKEILSTQSIPQNGEDQSVSYLIMLSNWFMGGNEYGAYSGSFFYPKRLKLTDLIYVSSSFFSDKIIVAMVGAPSYPYPYYGYVAAEFADLSGAKFYVLIAQTSPINAYFNINTLTIKDVTNDWVYYQNRYSEGSVFNLGQSFSYSLSNWNSSGTEFGGFGGSFSSPEPCSVEDLIVFRGGYSGGASIFYNAMAVYGYPVSAYGYLGILLRGQNTSQLYLAVISQFVYSFSINTFTLTSSIIHHQAPWNDGGHGTILNPISNGLTNYEGNKNNPTIGNGCILRINYTDSTKTELFYPQCPTVTTVKNLEVSDLSGVLKDFTNYKGDPFVVQCGDRQCPPETCCNPCEGSALNCCYDENGKLIDSFIRRT